MYRLIERTEGGESRPLPTLHPNKRTEVTEYENYKGNIYRASRTGVTNANFIEGNSKKGKTIFSFTEASIFEKPSAVIPHAVICVGAVG